MSLFSCYLLFKKKKNVDTFGLDYGDFRSAQPHIHFCTLGVFPVMERPTHEGCCFPKLVVYWLLMSLDSEGTEKGGARVFPLLLL